MENQEVQPIQTTQSLSQNPPIQSVIIPEKPKTNFATIGLVALACLIVFGFGGYYLGKQAPNSQKSDDLQSTPSETNSSTSPISTNTPSVITNKITLSETLTKYCSNNKIALDKLPFILGTTLKNAYSVKDTIDCFTPTGNFASISIIVNTPDFSGDVRNVYFFHKDSVWEGMGDTFQAINNYKPVTIAGQNYWLNVREPGPYGISTLSVWVDVIGEKVDPESGTIVRAIDNEILKDQDLIDLVRKYGEKQPEGSSPDYIIVDKNKKAQFIEEIVKLASSHNAFRKPAQNVASDLNGVSF